MTRVCKERMKSDKPKIQNCTLIPTYTYPTHRHVEFALKNCNSEGAFARITREFIHKVPGNKKTSGAAFRKETSASEFTVITA